MENSVAMSWVNCIRMELAVSVNYFHKMTGHDLNHSSLVVTEELLIGCRWPKRNIEFLHRPNDINHKSDDRIGS